MVNVFENKVAPVLLLVAMRETVPDTTLETMVRLPVVVTVTPWKVVMLFTGGSTAVTVTFAAVEWESTPL